MHARRRSRRPLILAAVVTAALTLGACASSGAPGDSDAGATGGELVWAIAGANLSAAHMDPQTSQLDSAASVQRGVLDSLVFQNADGTFAPWLAVLLLFVLSGVFAQGARMRADLEGTV